MDLPLEALERLLRIAASFKTEESVRDGLATKLTKPVPPGLEIASWISADITELDLRPSFADAAKSGEWFKRIDIAQEVGQVLIEYLDASQGSDIEQKLRALGAWAYGG
jgi:hypothetical protein